MKKWIRCIAMVLAAAMLLQCVPAQAAALMAGAEDTGQQEEVFSVQTELLAAEVLPEEETLPEPEPEPKLEPAGAPAAAPEPVIEPAADLGDLSWSVEEGVLTITGSGKMPDWAYNRVSPWTEYADEITSVVLGEGVTSVGSYAFYELTALRQVTLPDGLTSIGSNAFTHCSALEEVTIPDTVTYIGSYAFQFCSALRSVTLPAALTSLNTQVFGSCSALEEIEIPETVTYIGSGVFINCTSLRAITLPEGLTTLSQHAFESCSSLEEITIPDGVTYIGINTFVNCTSLRRVDLGTGVKQIDNFAFKACSSLGSITIPEGVTTLGQAAFSTCTSLVRIELPDSVTTMRKNTFQHCSSLEEVRLSENLTAIGDTTFQNCTSLRSITIPDSVTSIANSVFDGCTSLEEIRLSAGLTSLGNGALAHTAITGIELPAGLLTIGEFAFNECDSLQSIVMPDTVTSVGTFALANCDSLREVVFSAGMTEIQREMCPGCLTLERVVLPDGIETIHEFAFQKCPMLATVELPGTLTTLGARAFMDCTALETVTLPDTLTTMGDSVFLNCIALREVKLSESLTGIAYCTFQGCGALESIEIPASVTSIDRSAFYCCVALKRAEFHEGLTAIGDTAFYGCTRLEEAILPDTLTTLGTSAFEGCAALARLELGTSLTEIGGYTFKGCTSLTDVTIPDTVTTISFGAFSDCTALERLEIMENVTYIDYSSFSNCPKVTFYTHPDAYAWTYAIEHNIPVVDVLNSVDLTLTVLDEAGNALTDGVTIEWYASGSDEVLATGNALRGVNKQDLAYDYRIVLDETMSYRYHQPRRTAVVIEDGIYDLTRTLTAIDGVTLAGLVLTPEGTPLENAQILLTQIYNDVYEKALSAVTGADGSFELPADGVSGSLEITAEGYYSKQLSVDLTEKSGAHDLAEVTLSALPADRIGLSVQMIPAHVPGEQGIAEAVADADGLRYTIYNVTRDRAVTDFTVQLPWLILGMEEARAGDTLRIYAEDPNGAMTADPVTLTLDAERTGDVTIRFRQNGAIALEQVVCDGNAVMMVFGSDGKLAASAAAFAGAVTRNLPAGEYELVVLQENRMLRSVASRELLDQLGLRAGEDYALLGVTVQDGLITAVETVTVPVLNESLLQFMDSDGTFLRLSRTRSYPEQPITLRVSYRIDSRYPSDGGTIRIELPEHISMDSSVFLGGVSIPYTREGDNLLIPVHAPEGEIALYLSAEKVGAYSVGAMLSFETGGNQVLQPLGQARLTVSAGEAEIPDRVARTQFPISGTTMPERQVELYVNGDHVGTTASNAAGSWSLTVPLSNVYSRSIHELQIRVAGETDGTFHTIGPEYVVYNSLDIEVSHVVMHNEIHYGLPQTTVFHFLRPDPQLKYFVMNQGETYFSFRVYFTEGDDSVLRNVFLVMEDLDGDIHRVRCRYDKATNTWVTSYRALEPYDAPERLGVDYEIYQQPGDPVLDSQRAEDARAEIQAVMDRTDEELDAVRYVDDGSCDGMDVYELADQLDADMDELEQVLAEAQYCYDTGMADMGLAPEIEGNIFRSVLGPFTSESTLIELEEVDEEALLAEGYTKMMATNGSCLYRKLSGDTTYVVDPVSKTKMIVRCVNQTADAALLASGNKDIFQKNLDFLNKLSDAIGMVKDAIDHVDESILKTEERLEETILKGLQLEQRNKNRMIQMYEQMQELIRNGTKESELAKVRERYYKILNRMDKASAENMVNRNLLKVIRGIRTALKHLPIVSLAFNLRNLYQSNEELRKLYEQLPETCPGDPQGLAAVEKELLGLAGFIYTTIAVDLAMDIAGIVSLFVGATATAAFTGGASLAGAIAVATLMMAASIAQEEMVSRYVDVKKNEIENMIARLKCDIPKDQPEYRMPGKMVPAWVLLDPSGYVYEAVPGNRIEGVRAEIYYKDGDQDVLWNAAYYDQINPQYTDATGMFHWDVPMGQWLVKLSKDGYYDTDSRNDPAADDEGYLPVPPPQMEVNTAIISKAAPSVESVKIYNDEVLLIFSQYMQPGSVNDDTVTLSWNGAEVSGTIAPSDAEWNYEQTEQYATVFRFTPDTELSGEATVTIDNAVNYAGTTMETAYSETQTVRIRPEGIYAAETATMTYGTEYELEVQLLPAGAGAGQTITAESLAPALLRVDTPAVTADENGRAVITVYGELPGSAELKLGLEGTDLQTASRFTISLESETAEVCEKVTASIPNGSTVGVGTELELYTATEGAEIYYTLDGTCPCVVDSPSRIFYDGPITLTEDTFLIAYAVKEGFGDSPTAGFIYNICTHSDTLLENDRKATCTEDGYTGDVICDDCGVMVEQGSVIPAPGHDWDEGVVTVEPTEDHDGEKLFTCTVCREKRTEVLPALNHEHAYDAVVIEPTCTEGGFTTHTCRCGDSYTDSYTDALGHDMGQWYTVREMTCTADGLERRECSRCDHAEERTIEAAGHDYESVVTEPTCTKGGYTTHTCLCCAASYKDRYTGALGHDYESVVTEPTCTEGGYTTHTCLRCGTGYKDRYTNALGHSFGAWTAVGNGMEERACERCGLTEQRPASGPVNPFTDVPEGSFYYEPVLWAVEKGITNGTSATTFGPADQCLRAHVVTFLWRAAGSPEPSSTVNPFVDVKPADFYHKAVLWAVEKGVTNGLDATHFGPFAYCNRAQVVTFLYRSLGSPAVASQHNPFSDVPAGQWYTAPVLWAVEKGVTNGLSADQFGPTAICNRAQIVTFLYRAFAK